MGLISKIEDKLSGSSNKDDRVNDDGYGSTTAHPQGQSSLNHPTGQSSLSHPTGQHSSSNHPTTGSTTTQGIGSNSGVSGITGGTLAGGVPGVSHGQSVHGSNIAGTHGSNTHGSNTHGSNVAHDSRVSGHQGSNTHTHHEGSHIPGTHGSSSNTAQGSHIPGIHSSSNTSHHQGATHIPGTSHQDRTSHDEYGVNRSRDGGVTNQGYTNEGSNMNLVSGPHKDLQNPAAIPTAGGQKVGDGGSGPYDGSTTSTTHHQHGQHGQHHHGRDAALGAGAGAGLGAGAAAIGQHGSHETSSHPSSTSGVGGLSDRQHNTPQTQTGYGDNVSYMNRPAADTPLAQEPGYAQRHGDVSQGLGQHQQGHQTAQRNTHTGGMNTSSSMPGSQTTQGQHQGGLVGAMSGMSIEKKLAGAYEAGYRDGVEHTRAEMQHHGR